MSTTRTDIHRPSLADPAEYSYLGCFYQGASDAMAQAYGFDHRDLNHAIACVERIGGTQFQGNFAAKFTCDHCGASFGHGVTFYHALTKQYVSVGHICAENTIGLPDRATKVRKAAEKAQAEANERAKMTVVAEKFITTHPGLAEAFTVTHSIISDIHAKLVRWGSISEKQVAFVLKLAAEAKAPKAPEEVMVRVPEEGKLNIVGTVLSTKWVDNDFGGTMKMLVLVPADGGSWKLWVTVPSKLDVGKGDLISFSAQVERSFKDETFAFGKRPTKAMILKEAAA